MPRISDRRVLRRSLAASVAGGFLVAGGVWAAAGGIRPQDRPRVPRAPEGRSAARASEPQRGRESSSVAERDARDTEELWSFAEKVAEVEERVIREMTAEEHRRFKSMNTQEQDDFLRARVDALLDRVLVDLEERSRESLTPEERRELDRLPPLDRRALLLRRLRERSERRLQQAIDRALDDGCLTADEASWLRGESLIVKTEALLRIQRDHLEELGPGPVAKPGPHRLSSIGMRGAELRYWKEQARRANEKGRQGSGGPGGHGRPRRHHDGVVDPHGPIVDDPKPVSPEPSPPPSDASDAPPDEPRPSRAD